MNQGERGELSASKMVDSLGRLVEPLRYSGQINRGWMIGWMGGEDLDWIWALDFGEGGID